MNQYRCPALNLLQAHEEPRSSDPTRAALLFEDALLFEFGSRRVRLVDAARQIALGGCPRFRSSSVPCCMVGRPISSSRMVSLSE
jgi:hypothetical protein